MYTHLNKPAFEAVIYHDVVAVELEAVLVMHHYLLHLYTHTHTHTHAPHAHTYIPERESARARERERVREREREGARDSTHTYAYEIFIHTSPPRLVQSIHVLLHTHYNPYMSYYTLTLTLTAQADSGKNQTKKIHRTHARTHMY